MDVQKMNVTCFLMFCVVCYIDAKLQIPSFRKLKSHYPGYHRFGGRFTHRRIIETIGCSQEKLLHDTSALRLSYTLNQIGGEHSIGTTPIRLSTKGQDSVTGHNHLQYLYHPIAYGPFLVDKYGYPNVSVLHQTDPIATKARFWGKQGIIEVLTYRKENNSPVGHMALWDCDRFHQTRDWIGRHSLITVDFWPSPDSDCSRMKTQKPRQPRRWNIVRNQ